MLLFTSLVCTPVEYWKCTVTIGTKVLQPTLPSCAFPLTGRGRGDPPGVEPLPLPNLSLLRVYKIAWY